MIQRPTFHAIGIALASLALGTPVRAKGDPTRGAQAAHICVACHSFAPSRHLTGPNLTGVLGCKAGTTDGFVRYSDAPRQSGLVWDKRNLDVWLENPAALVLGSAMAFLGITDACARADLVAYTEVVSTGRVKVPDRGLPNLRESDAASRVTSIRFCSDTCRLTTADRKAHVFWEFNLRFKTGDSVAGPAVGQPILIGTDVQGDRAAVVFVRPEEISAFTQRWCP